MKKKNIFNTTVFLLFFLFFISCSAAGEGPRTRDFTADMDRAINEGIKKAQGPLTLEPEDKEFLLDTAHTILENHFSGDPQDLDLEIPVRLASLSNKVYLTLSSGGRLRACQGAAKEDLVSSVIEALYRCLNDKRFGGVIKKEEIKDIAVDITVLHSPQEIKGRSIKDIKKEVELGIDCISIRKGRKKAFFKNSVPVSHNYDLKTTLRKLCRKARLGRNAFRDPKAILKKYKSVQFCDGASAAGKYTDLYRNNRIVYQSEVTRSSQEQALRMCAEYLVNHIDENGVVTYDYDAYRDRRNMKDKSMIRSIAAVWSLAAMGNYFDNDEYINKAKKALGRIIDSYYVYNAEKGFGYFDINGGANIATAAFVLLAFSEIEDKDFYPEEKEALVRFILAMEDKKGGFLYPAYLPDKMCGFEKKEAYFPGEALTVLMALYEKEKRPECLAVTERVFDYYKDLFSRISKRANMAPWMSRAYTAAFKATGNRKYADFVFEMNDFVLKHQKPMGCEFVDMTGSFFSKGASYSAGVFAEGIAQAYTAAEIIGDKEMMQTYSETLLSANRFLMQCQYTQRSMVSVKNPALALGGVRTTARLNSVRVDSVQHTAFAFMGALRQLYEE